jgi:D-beta-D-heptose 7-phosphate kinase/D-beta-D-heptose 1-phosphate adenosyltransferase
MSSITHFGQVRVLCVGDVMLDRFVTGNVRRISPESPVPVLSIRSSKSVPGGAANVARNISSLGGECTLVSAVGTDEAARELRFQLDCVSRIAPELIEIEGRPTTEKVRYVAQGQHMLRTDVETTDPIDAEAQERVLSRVEQCLPQHHVVVLSDYAKGVLSDGLISGVIGLARARGIPVVVDPKSSVFERYAGATIITPNGKEVHEATGIDPTEDDAKTLVAGRDLIARAGLEHVLVTRAHRGMSLVSKSGGIVHIPASAREVFDVVGAGDTVVATLALALGAGFEVEEAARLANSAAGIVVGKRGTATVSQAELQQAYSFSQAGQPVATTSKVLGQQEAKRLVELWREAGFSVGFTNGCFDILHVGHLAILDYARAQCQRLIVGLNSDASVRRLKGMDRPVNVQSDRALLLSGLAAVDAVVIFDEDTPLQTIEALQPDVLVKGADYTVDKIVGADVVLGRGGQVLTCNLVPGRSSTKVIEKLRSAGQ